MVILTRGLELAAHQGHREVQGFFIHILETPTKMAQATQAGQLWLLRCLSENLGKCLFPTATEEFQHDWPSGHRKLHKLLQLRLEATVSLATFGELPVYPNPHPG